MLEKYKEIFSEERWNEICQIVKEKGMKISNRDFTNSEIIFIINETALSEIEKEGAILCWIKKVKLYKIAQKYNYSESAVKYHKKKVSKMLRTTCNRIFK